MYYYNIQLICDFINERDIDCDDIINKNLISEPI